MHGARRNLGVYARLRRLVRRNRRFYAAVQLIKYGPLVGFRRRSVRAALLRRGARNHWCMLNLGSGGRRHPAMVNVDITPITGPDVVADGYALPFRDGSFHLICCESVVEHVIDPERFLSAVARTLGVAGIIYLEVPFLQPMHSLPDDFTRWTKAGFVDAARRAGLVVVESGMDMGPGSACFWILSEWLALAICCGSRRVQRVLRYLLRWFLAPLLLSDLLFGNFSISEELASSFFFVARRMDDGSCA